MGSQYWLQPLLTIQQDGAALTAASAASMWPSQPKMALGNGYWDRIGKQWLIKMSGRISSVITTPGTARFDLRFGGTVVWDSQAILLDTVAAHSNVGWMLEVLLTCRAVGSAANFIGQGTWVCEDMLGVPATMPRANAIAMLPWNQAPAVGSNVDGTGALTVDMFFTQTVATGSLTLHQGTILEVN